MGGDGSGRRPNVIDQLRPEPQNPIANELFIPNYSGLQDVKKTDPVISAGGGISKATGDANYLMLSGSNASVTINIGAEDLTTTGDITATSFFGDGSNLTNVGAAAASALTITGKAAENITKGQCVYVSGATGSNPQFSLADNTDSSKHVSSGVATETKTTGQTILIRLAGELTGVDGSGGGEGWADGDSLYMSTAGALTNIIPTSGEVHTIAIVENNHAVTGQLLVLNHDDVYIAAASGEDIDLRMGDDVGATKVVFENYSDAEVGYVDSLGVISGSAMFVGVDPVLTSFTETDPIFIATSGSFLQVESDPIFIATSGSFVNMDLSGGWTATDAVSGTFIQDGVPYSDNFSGSVISGSSIRTIEDHTASGSALVVGIITHTSPTAPTASNYAQGTLYVQYTA